MQVKMFSKNLSFLSALLVFVLLIDGIFCATYTVGDEDEWNSGTGIDYHAWSRRYNFTVGDILVFKYSSGQHNVKEVTQETYQSCDASSGVRATYESGNDEVKLTEARKYNFICDKDSHCLGGMKFQINVMAASISDGNSNSNTTTKEPNPPPSPKGNSASTRRWTICCTIGIAILINTLF